jgi:hypothetical protein
MTQICCQTLGATWLGALREVYCRGELVAEEAYEVRNLAVAFAEADWANDLLLAEFASPQAAEEMYKVFFSREPNGFGHSYVDRFRGPRGRTDFSDVIELLIAEPHSKRAVLTLVGNGDGRVPCINAIHFLVRNGALEATYFARGQDMFCKFHIDALCIYEIARRVAEGISCGVGEIYGLISSAHIYVRDLAEVKRILAAYACRESACR